MNLWVLTALSFLIALLCIVAFVIVSIQREGERGTDSQAVSRVLETYFGKRILQHRLNGVYQKSYVRFSSLPILRGYVRRIRSRLETIHAYDEYTMRRETMKIVLLALSVTGLVVLLLVFLYHTLLFIFYVILAAVVANGVLINVLVNRVEDRLMKQSIIFLEDARNQYQHSKNVEESIYEAAQIASHEAAIHGERIYEILTSENQASKLHSYFEVAPNRYYKMFALISYLITEYGDKFVRTGSMYLHACAQLVQEINIDIAQREKIYYLLRGLTMVAVAPILFTTLLEDWARTYFPVMNDFYDGKAGLIVKLIFFASSLLAFVLLQKMLEHNDTKNIERSPRFMWEKHLYAWGPMKKLVDLLVPRPHKKLHNRLTVLLKSSNSPLTLEWLYVQRVVAFSLTLLLSIGVFVYMHQTSIHGTLYKPDFNSSVFGKLLPEEQQKAEQDSAFDRQVIQDLKQQQDVTQEAVIGRVSDLTNTPDTEESVLVTAQRIFNKYNIVQAEYYKWWELLIGICLSIMAYQLPVTLAWFTKQMRDMEMQLEVDQFHAFISILAEFERVSVENILEYMVLMSTIFREPLQTCLNNYNSGNEAALEQLKEAVPYLPFVRIVEKLQRAVEKIPLRAAFDDIEMQREVFREKRKEYYNRLIEKKAFYGRVIGFAPMAILIVLYLVVPMLYLSVVQMEQSLHQIRHIH